MRWTPNNTATKEFATGNRGEYVMWPMDRRWYLGFTSAKPGRRNYGILLAVEKSREAVMTIANRYDHPNHGRQV